MYNKLIYSSLFLFSLLCTPLAGTVHPTNAIAQAPDPDSAGLYALAPSRSDVKSPVKPLSLSQADLIAFGRVIMTESYWSADGHRIESATTVEVSRRLKGDAAKQIVIYTIGGFIDEENLGMMRPHEASFSDGEDVVVFAESHGDGYRLVNGAAGKYRITGENFLDHFSARRGSLQTLLNELTALSLHNEHHTLEQETLSPFFETDALFGMAQQYFVTSSHRKWAAADAVVPFYVHVNTQQADQKDGSRADFLAAIRSASETWTQVSKADFTIQYAGRTSSTSTSYNGLNEIIFMNKGLGERGAAAQIWYKRDLTLVEADIWINDDYDWNARGTLDSHELDLQSVLLHEFGHWLVLGHLADSDAIMYPKLSGGKIKRTLHHYDEQGISTIYPCREEDCGSVSE